MSEIKFFELKCQRCGGELERRIENGAEIYVCKSCGKTFEKQIVSHVADQLRSVLDEQKQEAVANLRRQLWAEMHEQFINSEKIVELSREIKKYLPDDYFANFCEIANSGNDRQVSCFLNSTPKSAMSDYADVVLDFMLKSVTASNLNAISLFIERAFKGDTQNYDKYITRYEDEAQKVSSGIYELTLTRNVFLAYSSKDIDKVLELCDYLERNKITCFLALRNLRHGRGAVDNYDKALKTAIDNCQTVVFVSSNNSRDMTCDALIKELSYIKKKDFENAPPECKRAYDRLPQEYMMPRVQYLIEDYKNDGSVAEGIVDEFFHDLEWCRSKEEVARRVSDYLTSDHETTAHNGKKLCKKCKKSVNLTAKFCPDCGSSSFFTTYEEYLASKIKFCSACGAKNNFDDKFCAECGSTKFVPTEKDYEALVAKREEEKKRKEEKERLRREEEACQHFIRENFDIQNNVLVVYVGKGGDVEIPAGVTAIANSAFYECKTITSIAIPDSVTSIGDDAFCDCSSLTSVIFGENSRLTGIGRYAFNGCTSLKSIVIGSGVTYICAGAFRHCTSLTSVTIGDGVTEIDQDAFADCKTLTSITVDTGNTEYRSIDGNLYSYDGKLLIQYAIGKTATSFTIPGHVTSIGDYDFN